MPGQNLNEFIHLFDILSSTIEREPENEQNQQMRLLMIKNATEEIILKFIRKNDSKLTVNELIALGVNERKIASKRYIYYAIVFILLALLIFGLKMGLRIVLVCALLIGTPILYLFVSNFIVDFKYKHLLGKEYARFRDMKDENGDFIYKEGMTIEELFTEQNRRATARTEKDVK